MGFTNQHEDKLSEKQSKRMSVENKHELNVQAKIQFYSFLQELNLKTEMGIE